MNEILDQEIKYLKGVGPKRADMLAAELNIRTCGDLLYYFPFKYIDRSRIYRIQEIDTTQTFIQVRGRITRFRLEGKGNRQRLIGVFSDGSGTIELVWFQGLQWVSRNIQANVEYIAFGRPAVFAGKLSIAHPELESPEKEEAGFHTALQPQYSLTEALRNSFITSRTIHRWVGQLLTQVSTMQETLPESLLKELRMMNLYESLVNMHFPENNDKLRRATSRLKFEELFYIQLNILAQKGKRQELIHGIVFSKVGDT